MSKESPFRRPYASRRRRMKAKRHLTSRAAKNKIVLRVLAFLLLALVMSLAIIFKDSGRSQMATGTLFSTEK